MNCTCVNNFLGLLLSEYQFSLVLCDRTGIWESGPLSFKDNLAVFYGIMACFAFAHSSHIGFDPNVIYVKHKPVYINITFHKDINKRYYYRVLRVLFVAGGIKGRGTVCYLAVRANQFFIIKELWQDVLRAGENEFLVKKISPLNEPCLPRIVVGVLPYVDDDYGVDYTNVFKPKRSWSDFDRVHERFVLQPVGVKVTDFCCKKELLYVFVDVIRGKRHLSMTGLLNC